MYFALELPAGDLYRPDSCQPGSRQCCVGQAGRADLAIGGKGRGADAPGRYSGRCDPVAAGHRCDGWRGVDIRFAGRRRLLHRLDCDGPAHRQENEREHGPRCHPGGGNRWPECHDRGLHGAAGTGGAGCSGVIFPERGPALFCTAHAVCAKRHCRPPAGNAVWRDG